MSLTVSWQNLLDELDGKKSYVWTRLKRIIEDENKFFIRSGVMKHDMLSFYKMMIEQLELEKDAYNINTTVGNDDSQIYFHIVSHGKLIKLHSGNSKRIFFIDDEIISDNSISEMLVKCDQNRDKFVNHYGKQDIYIKFTELPRPEIVKYLEENGVKVMLLSEPTPMKDYFKRIERNVLLDQSSVITMCSDLSFESESDNYNNLIKFLEEKKMFITLKIIDEVHRKIEIMGNSNEKSRFYKLKEKFIYVPDNYDYKFNLPQEDSVLLSTCIKCYTTLVTANKKLAKRIHHHFPEINCQLFGSAQLVGKK